MNRPVHGNGRSGEERDSHLPGVMLEKVLWAVAIASLQIEVLVVEERCSSSLTKFLQPHVNYAQIGTTNLAT
jgi:hypothetical protein